MAKVVTATSKEELSRKVNEYVSRGWEISGPVCTNIVDNVQNFLQTIKKDETVPEPLRVSFSRQELFERAINYLRGEDLEGIDIFDAGRDLVFLIAFVDTLIPVEDKP